MDDTVVLALGIGTLYCLGVLVGRHVNPPHWLIPVYGLLLAFFFWLGGQ